MFCTAVQGTTGPPKVLPKVNTPGTVPTLCLCVYLNVSGKLFLICDCALTSGEVLSSLYRNHHPLPQQKALSTLHHSWLVSSRVGPGVGGMLREERLSDAKGSPVATCWPVSCVTQGNWYLMKILVFFSPLCSFSRDLFPLQSEASLS